MTSGHGLRICMVGQRGVPATFGGIERHVEELGSRLAACGHEVSVFCRSNYVPDACRHHLGMHLRHVPNVPTKHMEAITHSALSTLVAMRDRPDIIHYHGVGPALVSPIPRYLGGARIVATVHALDADRAKWGWPARRALRAGSWLCARVPDATISVSRAIADHYLERYRRLTAYIPNGVTPRTPRPACEIVQRFGLHQGAYLLFVGRLVPEKAPDLLIRAFRHVPGDGLRLVLAGGSSFTDDYVRRLHQASDGDPRVMLTGYVHGPLLEELYANAAAFVLPSSVEGLPLTLLEAASYGTPVVASRIPPHVEVLGEDAPGGRLFPSGDEHALGETLRRVMEQAASERRGAARLRESVLGRYSWTNTLEATLSVYEQVLGADRRVPIPAAPAPE
jgi:glycosyltransferase involved in cell wall biosynthesis